MSVYNHRVHRPQDSVAGFFVSLGDAQRLLGNDIRFSNTSVKPNPIKPTTKSIGTSVKRFAMGAFGICERISLGMQSNRAGKIFLRSNEVAVETSRYLNPLREPLHVIQCRSGRYFLVDGFHRLFECARRGYTGWVYVTITPGDVSSCPDTVFPCFAPRTIEYVDEVL